VQADILSDAVPFAGANIDATITSRAEPGDAMTLTPAERTAIDGELTAAHGAGAWQTATGFAVAGDAMSLTPAERTTLIQAVDLELSTNHGPGSWENTAGGGAIAWTITIVNNLGTAIPGATVWVTTTTNPHTNVVASGTSDAVGNVTFYLDAGTYYVWVRRTGIDFNNPTQIVVV
jgi:hypothetical protein